MTKIEELRGRSDAYLATARKILDAADAGKRDLTAAEKRDFDGLQKKSDALRALIRSHDQVRGLMDGAHTTFGPLKDVVRLPMMLGEGVRAYRSDELMGPANYDGPGLGAYIRGMVTGNWAPEHRALGESAGATGGFLVPAPLAGFIIDLARARSVIVNGGAMTVPMESATLDIPRLLSDPTCTWRAENQDITGGDPTFGSTGLVARSLATLVAIPNELWQDSPLADGVVTNAITQAMAVALDTACLMGDGTVNQPLGITNQPNVQTHTLGTGDGATPTDFSAFVTAAGLVAQANGPSSGLSMVVSVREDTLLNNLQDTLHQPLRMPDVVSKMNRGVTSKIPTNLTQGSSTKASFSVVGDLSQVVIGMRQQFTLEISREAGDAFKKNQTLVRAIIRTDIGLLQPKWIVVVRGITGA